MNDNYYDNYSPITGPYSLHPMRNFKKQPKMKRNVKMTIRPKRKYNKLSKRKPKMHNSKVQSFFSQSSYVSSNINGEKNYSIEKMVRNNNKGSYYKNNNGKITKKNMVFNNQSRMTPRRIKMAKIVFPMIKFI